MSPKYRDEVGPIVNAYEALIQAAADGDGDPEEVILLARAVQEGAARISWEKLSEHGVHTAWLSSCLHRALVCEAQQGLAFLSDPRCNTPTLVRSVARNIMGRIIDDGVTWDELGVTPEEFGSRIRAAGCEDILLEPDDD